MAFYNINSVLYCARMTLIICVILTCLRVVMIQGLVELLFLAVEGNVHSPGQHAMTSNRYMNTFRIML